MKKLLIGIALAMTCLVAQAQNLVNNGDFEQGFTGWAKSTVSNGNMDFFTVEENGNGNHFFSVGTINEMGFLTQSFQTTANTYYDINFILRATTRGGDNHATVALNGVTVFDRSNLELGSFARQSVLHVRGTGGVTNLSLGAESTRSFVHFDNVSMTVSAVPEPQTYVMMLLGLGLIGYTIRRRQQG